MVASSKRYQFKIFFVLYFDQYKNYEYKNYEYSTNKLKAKISNVNNGGVGIM